MSQSSTKSSEQNLANWSDARLLAAIQELANMRGDGWSRFLDNYSDFVDLDEDVGWLTRVIQEKSRDASPESVRLVETLRKIEQRALPNTITQIQALSSIVQEIWRGTPEAMQLLSIFLVVDEPLDALETAILQRQIRTQGPNVTLELFSSFPVGDALSHLQPDWTRPGRFKYTSTTPLQKALYLLWERSVLVKVCKNPDCPAPYYIAAKAQQQYCGDECAAPFRTEAKLKWWNEVGKKRREQASKSQKKRGSRR